MAITVITAAAPPSILAVVPLISASVWASGTAVAWPRAFSTGQPTPAATAPTTRTLMIPLPNSNSACAENIRVNPFRGEIFPHSGLILAGAHKRPTWMRQEAAATTTKAASIGASTSPTSRSSPPNPSAPSPDPIAIASGAARNGVSRRTRSRPASGNHATTTSALTTRDAHTLTSWETATLPRLRESSRRRSVGCSVRELLSCSAMSSA